MPEIAKLVGAFIRWLFKGCRSELRDEIYGRLEHSWGGSYDFENYIIGIISVVVLLVLVLLLLKLFI